MNSNKLLKKQVEAEFKRRRLVFSTVMLLCFIYLSIALVLGDTGLIKYIELNKKKTALVAEIDNIEKVNAGLMAEIKSLKEDKFYLEKRAREEFGLARPDEYIYMFQYDR